MKRIFKNKKCTKNYLGNEIKLKKGVLQAKSHLKQRNVEENER